MVGSREQMATDSTNKSAQSSIKKECGLVRGLIGSGITELGKASYRNGEWHYYNAFFSLSIGIERLAKLILVANHIIQKDGALPDKETMELYKKKYGHKLKKLSNKVDKIAKKHELKLKYERPQDSTSIAIIRCLDSFANAGEGRYANFNFLDDPKNRNKTEPIKKWWQEIATPILAEHYKNEIKQDVKKYASRLSKITDRDIFLPYRNEESIEMKTVKECLERDGETLIVQKYGCYHTLRIVRWMAEVFINLPDIKEHEVLQGHNKYLVGFIRSDEHLKITKHWPVEIQH